MKTNDTVLIKVTVEGLAKDTEVKFNINKTEGVFKEVVFTSTSEKEIPIIFTAKKDELYTVTVEPRSDVNYTSIEAAYKDKDGNDQTLALTDAELKNIDKDTEVTVTIGISDAEIKKDIVFYIFVDKKAKPEPKPEPSEPENPGTTPETPEA